jgi:hypothetical protein
VLPSYPEWTWRCALLGDQSHIRMYEQGPALAWKIAAVKAAYEAADARATAANLHALGVDYVLWTSEEEATLTPVTRARLSSPEGFEVLFRSGRSFVARVR